MGSAYRSPRFSTSSTTAPRACSAAAARPVVAKLPRCLLLLARRVLHRLVLDDCARVRERERPILDPRAIVGDAHARLAPQALLDRYWKGEVLERRLRALDNGER